jgi:transcriptional regulator with XRE-family HTH domain
MKESEPMLIGARLRQLREQKQMSQGDIEERTGLLRCYVSRVENGHTVPSLETLERFAGVFDVPLYQLFFSGEEAPSTPNLTPRQTLEEITAGNGDKGEDAQYLLKLRNLLTGLAGRDRDVILSLAKRLASR